VSEGDVEDAERYFGSGLDGLIAVKKWFQSAEEFIRGNLVGYGIC
jgi:putative lipase involved disintegration of autophagic bodies